MVTYSYVSHQSKKQTKLKMMMNLLNILFSSTPLLTLRDWTNNGDGKSSSVCLEVMLEEDRDPDMQVLDKHKQCCPYFT